MAEKTKKSSTSKRVAKAAEKPAAKSAGAKKSPVKKVAAKKAVAVKKTAAKGSAKSAVKAGVKKVAAKSTVKKAAGVKKSGAKKTAVKKVAAKKVVKSVVDMSDPTLKIVKACYDALDDKKAEDLKVLDVRGKSPITNYFIIATANSEPHLRALANELEKTLKDLGVKSIGRESNPGSGWVVVDAFDFMAHLFLPEQRGMYGIETLWKDSVPLFC